MLKEVRFYLVIIGLPIVSLLGLLFNSFIVVLYCRRRAIRRKLTNVLLVNQALIDIFNCAVFCPAYSLNAALYYIDVPRKHVYIRIISNTFQQFSYMSSILNLVPLALDRCFAISYPLKHRQFLTKRVILIAIAMVWSVSFCLALIDGYIMDRTYIHGIDEVHLDNLYFVLTCIYHISFALLVVVNSFTYYKASKAVRKHCRMTIPSQNYNQTRTTMKIQKEQKLMVMFMIIFGVFFIAFSPVLVFNMLLSYIHMDFRVEVFRLINATSAVALGISSFFNPLIVIYMNENFKIRWQK